MKFDQLIDTLKAEVRTTSATTVINALLIALAEREGELRFINMNDKADDIRKLIRKLECNA